MAGAGRQALVADVAVLVGATRGANIRAALGALVRRADGELGGDGQGRRIMLAPLTGADGDGGRGSGGRAVGDVGATVDDGLDGGGGLGDWELGGGVLLAVLVHDGSLALRLAGDDGAEDAIRAVGETRGSGGELGGVGADRRLGRGGGGQEDVEEDGQRHGGGCQRLSRM